MKKSLFTIILISLFSCKKENITKPNSTTNSHFVKAKEYLNKNASDSAFYYFNLAKDSFLTDNDSVGAARSLVNMAIIQADKGDYYGSIETSLEADKFLTTANKKDPIINNLFASNYNNLAISSKSLKNYKDSEKYYQKALKLTTDKNYRSVIYNNIGDVLIMQNKPKLAKKYLENAIISEDSINYARALNNLAKAKFLENKNYDPLPELFTALKIRKKINDSWGENSSYATLADYYINKNTNDALVFAKMMLHKAIENKSPDDQLEALDKIIKLDPKNYLEYFSKFQSMNDSLQTARNKDKNQFAVFRYDLEGKKAENERLKANTVQTEYQNLILASLTIALLLALILIIIWYRKRQIRLQREKELEVKNTELKYSKKVHDKVANKVYHVMSEVENTANVDKDKLLDKLESIYHISRDISYEDKEIIIEQNFSQQLYEMLTSYSSDTITVIAIGNEEQLWKDIMHSSKIEIFYILQEFMINMKKHSHADHVIIKFQKENSQINISYSDNGIGIQLHSPKNGLRNTETRIKSLNGTINFDTEPETGLKINLSFPAKN